MKKILFALFALASVVLFASDSRREIAEKLYGRIQVVESGADYNVRLLQSGADLRVKIVESGENQIGRWKFVESGADFRVKFWVGGGGDISVCFVETGEGLGWNFQ